jgi:hypothetical protein
MSLRYFYLGPADLFNKLEREAQRVFLAAANSEKAAMCDHFFNFCITAHSMRDWVIHSQNASTQAVHDRCNRVDELAACRDIANASKHFVLKIDRNAVAKGAVLSRSSVVDVFEDDRGNHYVSEPRETIDISLVIEGHRPQESHQFTRAVIVAWQQIFQELNLPYESIYRDASAESTTVS